MIQNKKKIKEGNQTVKDMFGNLLKIELKSLNRYLLNIRDGYIQIACGLSKKSVNVDNQIMIYMTGEHYFLGVLL